MKLALTSLVEQLLHEEAHFINKNGFVVDRNALHWWRFCCCCWQLLLLVGIVSHLGCIQLLYERRVVVEARYERREAHRLHNTLIEEVLGLVEYLAHQEILVQVDLFVD